jgi:hypothetical protein
MDSIVVTDNDVEILVAIVPTGEPLVWVIDGDCLYDLPVKDEYVDMFLNFNTIYDVSEEYPDHNGIAVRFIKNDYWSYDFLTSEYFGSVLLSDPEILNLNDYPYGAYVRSPYAQFDGTKFIILDQDMSGLIP